MDLAATRINALIGASVDTQGVTNEQSVGYEQYNYSRYSVARQRLVDVGLTPASAFARLDLMPNFMAMATVPTGHFEMIGDTQDQLAPNIPGTWLEYASTRGASGPKPSQVARYNAGYLFVHHGWGETRAAVDETFWSTKWGPAPIYHGHADGLELTLASYGSRLLVDPGLYAYGAGDYRTYFKGRTAHNVVTVDGLAWTFLTSTSLLSYNAGTKYVDIRLQAKGYAGVTHTRRITYSRRLDYIVVEDRLTSSTTHTYRQLWHLPQDAKPALGVTSAWTQRTAGNVLIRQLTGSPALRMVSGQTSPIQGWISYVYGVKVAAPVVDFALRGTSVRYVTFILPARGKPAASLSG